MYDHLKTIRNIVYYHLKNNHFQMGVIRYRKIIPPCLLKPLLESMEIII